MVFEIGAKVEVIGNHYDGSLYSYYVGVVISKEGSNHYKVKYETRLKEDKSGSLIEVVDSSHLRPIPPTHPESCYSLGEMVDAFENGGWWVGLIDGKFGSDYFRFFPENRRRETFFLGTIKNPFGLVKWKVGTL
ncbi:hypothetical protein M9H77_13933 [Catharanthus roseus]|uniref:Uncharacterized protein n=1 Tax=Catharanthus roseus TaxID=4058 RepID=A0ACC0BLW9_CATRO|nr:hypothetical protein M9H77_13933 [Catharanthus roseus]